MSTRIEVTNKSRAVGANRPRFLDMKELAEMLRLKTRTIYDMVSQRRIPYRKAGDRTIVIRQQVEGDQVFPINDVKRSFAYACVKAKIADFRFHDLRHTAATRLADRGADAFQIAAILGHSSIQMTARYTHATSDGLRRAMESLAVNDKQVGKISPTIPPQFSADGQEANAQIAEEVRLAS